MKKIIFSLIIIHCSLIIANAQSGWFEVTNQIDSIRLNKIQFTSINTGYAIGYHMPYYFCGYLYKTINAGKNWQIIYLNFGWCWSLYFVDDNIGYVVGDYVARTTNGGYNWTILNTITGLAFLAVYFVNYNIGYIGGKYNDFRKTTDGGNTWISKPGAIAQEFNDIYFFDANTGFAIGNSNKINKTTDGGENWIQTNVKYDCMNIKFVNNLTGFISTYYGIIIKTTNCGNNWFYLDSLPNAQSIYFQNSNIGYACGFFNFIYRTTNSGVNWFLQTPYIFGKVWSSVYFTDSLNGYVCGVSGLIMKTTNGGNVFVNQNNSKTPDDFQLYQNYPNPFNPSTKIEFDIPNLPLGRGVGGMIVSLKIYDILGKEIATLVNEPLSPGSYEVDWNASSFPSGIYFYKLNSREFSVTKNMVLIK